MILTKEIVDDLYKLGKPSNKVFKLLTGRMYTKFYKQDLIGIEVSEKNYTKAIGKINDKKIQLLQRKKKANKNKSSKRHNRKIPQIKNVKVKPYSHPKLGTDEYNKFYSSTAWRQLRYLALKNAGGCQCCGAKASDGVQIHVDHIKPRSRYPELELSLDNIQVLCEDCNMGKGDWDDTDWRGLE